MGIDKHNIRTQDELDELAPIDEVEDRVEAKMKKLEGSAKKNVADGLGDKKLAREAEKLTKEGERKLRQAKEGN
jgi:uncharacterized protein YjbJ (UPF0337 family)